MMCNTLVRKEHKQSRVMFSQKKIAHTHVRFTIIWQTFEIIFHKFILQINKRKCAISSGREPFKAKKNKSNNQKNQTLLIFYFSCLNPFQTGNRIITMCVYNDKLETIFVS